MTTDIAIPLDGKLTLTADPHPYRVAKPHKPRKSRQVIPPEELQAQRREAVRNGAIYVKGKQGVTVFRGSASDSFSPFKVWDGHHEATPKPRPRKLVPGEGFAD
jgi:hypothetical protein